MKYLKIFGKILFFMLFYLGLQILMINNLNLSSSLLSLSISAVISAVVYVLIDRSTLSYIRRVNAKGLILSISTGFLTVVTSTLVALILYYTFPEVLETSDNISNLLLSEDLFQVILAVVIMAPIIEELIFRLLVYGELRKALGVKISIILQAILFGLYHANLYQFSYAFIIGLIFGYIFHKTENITVTIIAHMINNLISVLIVFYGGQGIYFLISLVLSVVAIINIKNLKKSSHV